LIQILVPIYNEGENVLRVYEDLVSEGVSFDVLRFVYDLDTDTSLPYLEKLHAKDSRAIADKNEFGRGVVNALRWGFSKSSNGPVIVVMGDSSDKLSVISEMISLWENGATVVSPSRYMPGGKQHGGPPLKSAMSRVAGKILALLGFPTSDATNNFKLYDGEWLRQQTIESQGGFEIALELCYKAYSSGKVIKQLPTEWWDRTDGESNFKLWSWLPHYLSWYLRILRAITTRALSGSAVK
jgi:glycosyltransferase involved in cell wall biosynthesis